MAAGELDAIKFIREYEPLLKDAIERAITEAFKTTNTLIERHEKHMVEVTSEILRAHRDTMEKELENRMIIQTKDIIEAVDVKQRERWQPWINAVLFGLLSFVAASGAVFLLVWNSKGTKFEPYVMIFLSNLSGFFGSKAIEKYKIADKISKGQA